MIAMIINRNVDDTLFEFVLVSILYTDITFVQIVLEVLMPTPNPGEDKTKFIQRCVKQLISDEGYDRKQALAICYNLWSKNNDSVSENNILSLKNTSELMQLINEGLASDTGSVLAAGLVAGPVGAAVTSGGIIAKNLLSHDDEDDEVSDKQVKPDAAKLIAYDRPTNANKIQRRPQGVIITDTRNHPVFPLSMVSLDTSKFWLPTIQKEYHTKYSKMETEFLPWHYTVEMIGPTYYAFCTRPVDMRFPLTNNESYKIMKANGVSMNKETKYFFKNQPVEMQDCIHVCLIGDSTKDIYTKKMYQLIGRACAGPFLRYFRLPIKIGQAVHAINMGNRFKPALLDNELRL